MREFVLGALFGGALMGSMLVVDARTERIQRTMHPVAAPRAYWTMPDDGRSIACNVAFAEVR